MQGTELLSHRPGFSIELKIPEEVNNKKLLNRPRHFTHALHRFSKMLFIKDAEGELVPISFLAIDFQTHRPINQISNASFAYFSVSCSDCFKGRQTFKGFLSPLPMSSLLTWLEFTAAPKLLFFSFP